MNILPLPNSPANQLRTLLYMHQDLHCFICLCFASSQAPILTQLFTYSFDQKRHALFHSIPANFFVLQTVDLPKPKNSACCCSLYSCCSSLLVQLVDALLNYSQTDMTPRYNSSIALSLHDLIPSTTLSSQVVVSSLPGPQRLVITMSICCFLDIYRKPFLHWFAILFHCHRLVTTKKRRERLLPSIALTNHHCAVPRSPN